MLPANLHYVPDKERAGDSLEVFIQELLKYCPLKECACPKVSACHTSDVVVVAIGRMHYDHLDMLRHACLDSNLDIDYTTAGGGRFNLHPLQQTVTIFGASVSLCTPIHVDLREIVKEVLKAGIYG